MEEWNMALDKHGDGQTSPSPPTLLKLKLKTFGWAWCRCLTHLAEWMEKWKWTYETLEIWRILKFQSHSLQKTKVLFIVRSVGSQLLSIAMTASSQGGEISIFICWKKWLPRNKRATSLSVRSKWQVGPYCWWFRNPAFASWGWQLIPLFTGFGIHPNGG